MMEWEAFIPDPPPKPDEAENVLFVYVFLSEDFLDFCSRHVQC